MNYIFPFFKNSEKFKIIYNDIKQITVQFEQGMMDTLHRGNNKTFKVYYLNGDNVFIDD